LKKIKNIYVIKKKKKYGMLWFTVFLRGSIPITVVCFWFKKFTIRQDDNTIGWVEYMCVEMEWSVRWKKKYEKKNKWFGRASLA
jgi:hypothetical protein